MKTYSASQLLEKINTYLQEMPYSRPPKGLYDPIEYELSLGGKRIRPVLMLMAYNLYKEDVETILPQAAGLETYHNHTLLHDDVMDKADMRRNKPTVHRVWSENAAILSGGSIGTHLQMGIGDGIIPKILDCNIYDDICIINDDEALQTSRDLASKEGILCGISSGTNVAAAIKLAKKLGKGKTVVTVLPDTAERYFSTPLFTEK